MFSSGYSNPHGLATTGNADVWIADTGNNRIMRVDALDWDGDGIPDAKEGGTTPYVVGVDDRFVDSDGDGHSNAEEYLMGTDPRNPASFFKILSVTRGADGSTTILWPSVSNQFYLVYYSSDLKSWQLLQSVYAFSYQSSAVDNVPAGTPQRFYKVIAVP